MPLVAQQDIQGLLPFYQYGPSPTEAVNLGVGGPYGIGGAYKQGSLLGAVTTVAANEVITLNVSGSPTGTKIAVTYTADKPYTGATANLVSAQASLAQLQAVCDSIWGAGNTVVGGTPGTTYTITFGGGLANTRINGNFVATATFTAGTSPALATVRTTRGSCGPAQYELYDGSSGVTNEVDAILGWDITLDPTGARVAYPGRISTGQPFQPTAYIGGYFDPTALLMLGSGAMQAIDANAYTLGKLFKKRGGQVVRLI